MKKLIFVLFLFAISLTGFSQVKHWQGFLRPVDVNLFKNNQTAIKISSSDPNLDGKLVATIPTKLWIVRPVFEVTAVRWDWNKIDKRFYGSPFSSAGIGIGYQHFINVNDLPYNNFGFNALLLFGNGFVVAGTFEGFGLIDIGVGYDFTIRTIIPFTGIKIKF